MYDGDSFVLFAVHLYTFEDQCKINKQKWGMVGSPFLLVPLTEGAHRVSKVGGQRIQAAQAGGGRGRYTFVHPQAYITAVCSASHVVWSPTPETLR